MIDVQDTMTLGGGDDDGDEDNAFHVLPRNMQFGIATDLQEEQGGVQSTMEMGHHDGLGAEDNDVNIVRSSYFQARDEAFQDAQRAAALLTVSDLEIVECPPKTLNAPGLYLLLSEGPVPVLDKALLSQPEQCMAVLTKMEEDGELVTRIPAALGPWILWRVANMVSRYSPFINTSRRYVVQMLLKLIMFHTVFVCRPNYRDYCELRALRRENRSKRTFRHQSTVQRARGTLMLQCRTLRAGRQNFGG